MKSRPASHRKCQPVGVRCMRSLAFYFHRVVRRFVNPAVCAGSSRGSAQKRESIITGATWMWKNVKGYPATCGYSRYVAPFPPDPAGKTYITVNNGVTKIGYIKQTGKSEVIFLKLVGNLVSCEIVKLKGDKWGLIIRRDESIQEITDSNERCADGCSQRIERRFDDIADCCYSKPECAQNKAEHADHIVFANVPHHLRRTAGTRGA